MKTLNDYTNEIMGRAKAQADMAAHDYYKAVSDCKQGIYDKWYRYNRNDDGYSYDLGWMNQNQETQNDVVRFING